jgi:hypothetical protein
MPSRLIYRQDFANQKLTLLQSQYHYCILRMKNGMLFFTHFTFKTILLNSLDLSVVRERDSHWHSGLEVGGPRQCLLKGIPSLHSIPIRLQLLGRQKPPLHHLKCRIET